MNIKSFGASVWCGYMQCTWAYFNQNRKQRKTNKQGHQLNNHSNHKYQKTKAQKKKLKKLVPQNGLQLWTYGECSKTPKSL